LNIDPAIRAVHPPNLGWLEKTLSVKEVDFLWNCIKQRQSSVRQHLAGNITESNDLIDEGSWFFQETLFPLVRKYETSFKDLSLMTGITGEYYLSNFWVNFQHQHEFNPTHNHTGIYSFVVWLQIPTTHREQNEDNVSNAELKSTFQFQYLDILGKIRTHTYYQNPHQEGTLLFFPSEMYHAVYPFYNCDETRVSISGNITLKPH